MKKFITLIVLLLVVTIPAQAKRSLGGKKIPKLAKQTPFALITLSSEDGESHCSGTLITATHILTAGHCVETPDGEEQPTAENYTVRVGGADYLVTAATAHPDYDANAEINNESSAVDISILTLAQEVTNITPLPVATVAPEVGDKAFFFGYGTKKNPKLPALKRAARGKVKITADDDGVFTAIRKPKKRFSTSCPGDSGGGLVSGKKIKEAVLIGTVSAGSTGQTNKGACKSTKKNDDDIFVNILTETNQDFINGIINPEEETE